MNGCESIEITQAAQDDLLAAYWFYEHQQAGIGAYFLNSLYADIDALQISAGVHIKVQPSGAFRSLGSRFPFAIYSFPLPFTLSLCHLLFARRQTSHCIGRAGHPPFTSVVA